MSRDIPQTARVASHLHGIPKWWIRSPGEHTVDPNWERGEYLRCHGKMREAVGPGAAILDVVWNGSATIVRSAWVVADKRGDDVLRFTRFYFVPRDGPFVVYRNSHFRSPPAGAILEGDRLKDKWRQIAKEYEFLSAGARPRIFELDDWHRMCSVAEEKLSLPHKCSFDSKA